MARPTDWSPLTDRDPVPGDHYTVATTGKRYSDTADLIDEQAARLRRLATDATFDSEAGRVFRDHAGKTADSIVRAKKRYEEVGGYLTEWSQILDDAQERSLDLLEQARDADDDRRSNSTSLISGVDDPTDAQMSAESARQDRHDDAVAALTAIRGRLDSLRGDVEGHADRIAGMIRKACNDDVKDGWWDKVKGWIKDNADFLKAFADVMGWIATIAGVLALVLSMTGILAPLAALLTVVALVATALSLLANVALAAAGEGSWWAVAFDVVALLTFGAGRVFMAGAKAGFKATTAAAKPIASTQALRAFATANRSGLTTMRSLLNSRFGPIRLLGRFHRLTIRFQAGVDKRAALRWLETRPPATIGQRIKQLDSKLADYVSRARAIEARYPFPSVSAEVSRTVTNSNRATISIGTGVIADGTGKVHGQNNPFDLPDKWRIVESGTTPLTW